MMKLAEQKIKANKTLSERLNQQNTSYKLKLPEH